MIHYPYTDESDDVRLGKINNLLFQAPELVQQLMENANSSRRSDYLNAISEYGVDVAQHGLDVSQANLYRQGWQSDQDAYAKFHEENRIPLAQKLMEVTQNDPNVPDFVSVDPNDHTGSVFAQLRPRFNSPDGVYMPDWSYGPDTPLRNNSRMLAGLVPYGTPQPLGQETPWLPGEAWNVNQASNLGNVLTTYGNPSPTKDPYFHDLQNPWDNSPFTFFNPEYGQATSGPEIAYQASGESFVNDPQWELFNQSGQMAHKIAARQNMGGRGSAGDALMLKAAHMGIKNLDDMQSAGLSALDEQQAATQAGIDAYSGQYGQYEQEYDQYKAGVRDFTNIQNSQAQFDNRTDKYVRDMRQTYDDYYNVPLGSGTGSYATRPDWNVPIERIDAPGVYYAEPYNYVLPQGAQWASTIANDMYGNTQNFMQQQAGYGINRGQDIAGARPQSGLLPTAPSYTPYNQDFTETNMPTFDNTARDYVRKAQNINRMRQIQGG